MLLQRLSYPSLTCISRSFREESRRVRIREAMNSIQQNKLLSTTRSISISLEDLFSSSCALFPAQNLLASFNHTRKEEGNQLPDLLFSYFS